MGFDHHRAPLLESLRAFVGREQAPFYSPGHKGGRTMDPWLRDHLAAVDLNNLPDTDTLHCPEGPILEAERLIADAWGVPQSFVMVQGSTGGNIAVALTALRPDEPVLVARNAHKSVLAGLVQVGARPVWLEPRWDSDFGVAHGLDADVVERAFRTTGAAALWVLHPTYFGTTGDIAALAGLCRRYGARLLVDGAHSPHFAFHPDLPRAAEQSGAAATVQSVHKILSGLSQAAVLHIDTAQLDEAAARRALQLVQTTSPYFGIMASIDDARRQMVLDGRAMLEAALGRARGAADRLSRIPGLTVLRPGHLAGPGTGLCELDETKLLVGTAGLAADAREVLARLNSIHGVQPELAGTGHVLCISTIGNTDADFDRLTTAFAEVSAHFGRRDRAAAPALTTELLAARPAPVLTPREAFFAPRHTVELAGAAGCVAAEAITPYPPGIPLVTPGERLDADVIGLLTALRDAGNPISAADPTLGVVTVVR
ncbi:arginine/lysine/ornithine decarboxylase [Mycolicibacterium chubuense NBB4]|uniref:Arginine/lysine/ornithine decarboxylase n=2 Tax=Mycolicibacterium chubuense TaxID=1800 RepID=I4BC53_MYCCN|nr:arginine/lysine/ornithine decarboxylase [Mycolicibacterium chubuense NBB4]